LTAQKYERLYDYIHEYQGLVYDFYSSSAVAFLTTYYHIDTKNTVWDNKNLMGGSYEKVGTLSGIRFYKILLLPVFFSEELSTIFDAQDIGYIKEGETTFVIPSTYNFIPLPGDKVKFEQDYLRVTNNIYPIYSISGVEKSTNTDRVFYKLRVRVEQSITENQLDLQVSGNYTFFDYTKSIYKLEDAQKLATLLSRNKTLKDRLVSRFYDRTSGFYFSQ